MITTRQALEICQTLQKDFPEDDAFVPWFGDVLLEMANRIVELEKTLEQEQGKQE